MAEFKRIKVIPSYSGLARFIASLDNEEPIGYIPRQPQIPSPYHYSPAWGVDSFGGKPVIWREVRHRRYEVFEVPSELIMTEEAATEIGANVR